MILFEQSTNTQMPRALLEPYRNAAMHGERNAAHSAGFLTGTEQVGGREEKRARTCSRYAESATLLSQSTICSSSSGSSSSSCRCLIHMISVSIDRKHATQPRSIGNMRHQKLLFTWSRSTRFRKGFTVQSELLISHGIGGIRPKHSLIGTVRLKSECSRSVDCTSLLKHTLLKHSRSTHMPCVTHCPIAAMARGGT